LHLASSTVHSQRSNVPTLKRSNASTLQPSIRQLPHVPTANRQALIANLILEKKKIQITIEEQMLKPPFLCFSPIPRGPSIVNRLFSTFKRSDVQTFKRFHLQPSAIDPRKREFKKQTKTNIHPPIYTPRPHHTPTYMALGRITGRIEWYLYRIVPKQLSARRQDTGDRHTVFWPLATSPWFLAMARHPSSVPHHTSRSPAVGLPGLIQGLVGGPQSEIISQKSKISSA
jgi:hypothetical protein